MNFFATALFINLNNVKILMKIIKDYICNIVGVMMIKEGLYEQIINEEVLENLNELDKEKYIIDKEKLDNEEARAILAQYIESVIRKSLNYVRDKAKEDNEKLLKQIEACNKIVYILSEVSNEDDIKKYKISENGEILTALYSKINNKRAISKE